jgi:predicted GH43/DUF377 family glycosyl hydrolase
VIIPANKGNWNVKWTKSGAIVPEKIDGKYWMYFLGTSADNKDQAGLAYSEDLMHWTEATKTPVLPVRPGQFDSRVAEPGPSPILTPNRIILVYNGADDKLVYRTGIAIFDRKDPRKLIWRSERPIFEPEKEWERGGQVPNVVFVEGMLKRGERYLFYYGAADKYVGVAETAIARLFIAQRNHGIHSGCTTGGNIRGDRGDECQERGGGQINQGLSPTPAKE